MRATGILTICLALAAGAAFAADAPKAPEPDKSIDAAQFFTGRWYEIARTPMSLTTGCVAGYTDYQSKDGGLYERDACRDKSPTGEEKVIGGPLTITNPGQNNKVHVTYHVLLGIVPIQRDYWMLDHGEGWFIMATPDLKTVNLYTRNPHPEPALVERMTQEIKAKGYAGPLEFPTQSSP